MPKIGYTWYFVQLNQSTLKILGGKQRGKPCNTWFDGDYRETQRNYHIVLNSSHLVSTSRTTLKNNHMMIWDKKLSSLGRKQKQLK